MELLKSVPRGNRFERIVQPRWLGSLLLVWTLVLVAPMLVPASWWIELDSLEIADTDVGQSPAVMLDYRVHHRILAEIIFRLEYESSPGAFAYYCRAALWRVFQPDEVAMPIRTDLAWVTGAQFSGNNCVPKHPGTYRVRVEMTLQPAIGAVKTVGLVSNPFTAGSP